MPNTPQEFFEEAMKEKTIKQKKGGFGEDAACLYLEKNGYNIVARNFKDYKARSGELDIIAENGERLAFIEVKTRTGSDYGEPSEAVTRQKIKHIKNVAKYYIHINNLYNNYFRFDVIELKILVHEYTINHIKMAFE